MDYVTWLRIRGARERTVLQREQFRLSRLRHWGTFDVPATQIRKWLGNFGGWTKVTYYGHLVSIYDWAVEVGEVPTNVARTIDRPRTPRPRPRPLSRDEIDRALAEATGDLRTQIQLGLLAGLRAHEIANGAVTAYRFDHAAGADGRLALSLFNFVAPLEEAGAPITSEPDRPAGPK